MCQNCTELQFRKERQEMIMASENKLTFRKVVERFSYGCGDFGCNIIYTAMSAFLLFYYTDYAGVSAAAVGTIMLISRIFDGVSDILMGYIVDHTKSRFGKARPAARIVYSLCNLRHSAVLCAHILDNSGKACVHLHHL